MNDPRSPGPGVRATTADRDGAIDHLTQGFASGALDVDEFERRVTVAHISTTRDELAALTADLPATTTLTTAPSPRALVPVSEVRAQGRVVTVLGNAERKGAWRVPRRTNVLTVLGNGVLDLREAALPPGLVELRVVSILGSVEILVPPHLAVEAEGIAVLGNFEHVDRALASPPADATTVRITGVTVLGNVEIEMRLPGETGRDARRRRKQRALPPR